MRRHSEFRRLCRAAAVSALPVVLASTAAVGADDFRVGEPRQPQQGNFCNGEAAVDEIAGLFERFGAPTGFAALSASDDCALQVHGFTPQRLHRAVDIALNDGDFYTVRFILVTLTDGARRILVTTRGLEPSH